MTVAPRMPIARYMGSRELKACHDGISPCATDGQCGCTSASSMMYPTPMVAIRPSMIASRSRKFLPFRPSTISVSNAVSNTPVVSEHLKSKWKASAPPSTSARSQATIDSSASSH